MLLNSIKYQRTAPDEILSDYVQCFWSVNNTGNKEQTFTILPDGYFDILFRFIGERFHGVSLSGLWTKECDCLVRAKEQAFAISFKLPAAEYLLRLSIAACSDKEIKLPDSFWDMRPNDFQDFNHFVKNTTARLSALISGEAMDGRKQNLFRILYAANGDITVKEIAEKVYWSSRQINRYFNDHFGISLKSYGNILRYRASFDQLKDKVLYPGPNYADQSHFIKTVKKYSGTTPGQIARNKNDRFIQLSTLRKS